jgi:hypothetical protein
MKKTGKPDGRGKSEGSKKTYLSKDRFNANGRPMKGTSISDVMKSGLEDWVIDQDDRGRNIRLKRKEKLARRLFKDAAEGNDRAMKILLEYTEGKPVQKVEISGEGASRVNLLEDEEKDV